MVTRTQSLNLELTHKCDIVQGRSRSQTLNLEAVLASKMAPDWEKAAFSASSRIGLGLIAIRKAALEAQRARMRGEVSQVE